MLDVAALAGVGLKTVSRVVNAEPGVSPALEAKVPRAIEQLNFRRDANASMLRRLGGKTQTIGLVLEDVANPFSSALHRAIEDSARARNVLVFAGSCEEDATRERELIGSFRDRRVDGIIVVPAGHDHTYLYDGHRRIAFLGDLLSISTAHDRLQGYTQALLQAGIGHDPALGPSRSREPGPTPSRSRISSPRRSPSSRRIRKGSGRQRPSCCSAGSTATRPRGCITCFLSS